MDSDKVENSEEANTFEGAHGYSKETKENSHIDAKECEERSERRSRNRTEKGLEFDLEIGAKKQERAAKDVQSRIDAAYESLREPADLVKLNACKDGLQAELDNLKTVHENLIDLLIRLELNEREQREHDRYVALNDAALECLADIKIRIKDQEIERVELLSQRSQRSKKSPSSFRSSSTSSSKRAAIETARLKAKLDSLKRLQEIDRRRDELKQQEKELERLNEEEKLHGELSAAIQKILQESELNDTITLQEASNSVDPTEKQRQPKDTAFNSPIQPQGDTSSPEKSNGQDKEFPATTPPHSRDENAQISSTTTRSSLKFPLRLDVNTPAFVPRDVVQSAATTESSEQYTQLWRIQEENAKIQKTQVELLRRMTVPVPKPPVFEGNILEYPKWENAFDALIEDQVVLPNYKLYYLGEYTSGAAQKTISGLLGLRTEDAYKRARKILKERFGDPFRIYEAYRDKLRNWPPCVTSAELQEFSDFLVMTQETMKSVKYLKELESYSTIRELAARLPTHYSNKWRENAKKVEARYGEYTFANFVEFTQESSLDANHPVFSHDALTPTRKELEKERNHSADKAKWNSERKEKKRGRGTTHFNLSDESSREDPEKASFCPLCKGRHSLVTCKNFLEKTVKERQDLCMSKGLCFSCLGPRHTARQCKRKTLCELCKKPHATVLHRLLPEQKNEEKAKETVKATNNCVSCSDTTTSMILPVLIHHKDDPDRRVKVYAVLDDQSDTCFITDDIAKSLGVTGPAVKLELGTMHAVENIDTQKIEGLVVSRFDGQVDIPLPKAYTRNLIPGLRGQIPRPETARKYEHLKTIADEIPPYDEQLSIGLLIGNNCARALKPRSVVPGKSNDPYAIRTILGWGVVGAKGHGNRTDGTGERAECYCTATKEVGNEQSTGLFVPLQSCKEILAPLSIKRMFEQDFAETQDLNLTMSQEDLKFMNITVGGIHKADNGHYEIPLPLRDESVRLPCNRKLAEARLKQLKRRLENDPKYKQDYVTFMEKMIADGHAEKAPNQYERAWYISHHGVYHPKKPEKLRVVFDCSAEFQGHSLNRHLLQGPDLTNTLIGVLCRFRQEPVAFACDIEGMFHQVHVNEEHRDLLRFLWWDQGDTTKEPTKYRMTVHLFGATSSPGCANLALRTAADDSKDDLGVEAASFIKETFYVDDGLRSVPTVPEATKLIKNATEMCMRGGFKLHKFTSNSKEVVESIPVESRAKEIKEIDLNCDLLIPERVLGVEWNIENDVFKFRITLKDKPLTRRGILSTVSSIYDPLGFAAPFLFRGKRILQLLCKENLDWDDAIPDELRTQWEM